MLPVGKATALDPLRTTVVTPTVALTNQLLAVSFASSEKQVPFVNVAGFVHVYVQLQKRFNIPEYMLNLSILQELRAHRTSYNDAVITLSGRSAFKIPGEW